MAHDAKWNIVASDSNQIHPAVCIPSLLLQILANNVPKPRERHKALILQNLKSAHVTSEFGRVIH